MIALVLALSIEAAEPAPPPPAAPAEPAPPAAPAAPAAPAPDAAAAAAAPPPAPPPPPPVAKLYKPMPPSIEESAWEGTSLTKVSCAARMDVDNKGRVKTVTLEAPESCPGAFGAAMLTALKAWQFVPALEGPKPVPSTYSATYEFRKPR
jgi:periplasmic protein TonB